VRENRVIAGIAHDRWSRSLNAAMNKTTHIEIIAETSKRLRGFSLANMICSPWLEGSKAACRFRRLDGLDCARTLSLRPWEEPELI
jgi:hypothetical protein